MTSTRTPFVGRERELSALDRWYASRASCPVIVVDGRRGAGASRLVARWLSRFGDETPVPVWCWPRCPDRLVVELSALPCARRAGSPSGALLAEAADGPRGLLVVDGVRDAGAMQTLCSVLSGVDRGAAQLKVVVTASREALATRTAWERVTLEGLETPENARSTMATISATAAGQAILRWAPTLGGGWLASPRQASRMCRLVRAVGGLPMALLVALAGLPAQEDLDAWLDALEAKSVPVEGGGEDVGARVLGVARRFLPAQRWYDELASVLSVFDGWFPLELVERLGAFSDSRHGPIALDAIHALHRAGLLHVARGDEGTRYHLADIVRRAPTPEDLGVLAALLEHEDLSASARLVVVRSIVAASSTLGVAPLPGPVLSLAERLWSRGATATLESLLSRVAADDAAPWMRLLAANRDTSWPATLPADTGHAALSAARDAHLEGDLELAADQAARAVAWLTEAPDARRGELCARLLVAAIAHERGELETARQGYLELARAAARCDWPALELEIAASWTLLELASGRAEATQCALRAARAHAAKMTRPAAPWMAPLEAVVTGGQTDLAPPGAGSVVERLIHWTRQRRRQCDWRVARDGGWFEGVDGGRIDVGRRGAARRMLLALVCARVERPGDSLGVAELFAAGWPGADDVDERRAANRVHVNLSALRKLGLEPVLERVAAGYRLSPDVVVSFG